MAAKRKQERIARRKDGTPEFRPCFICGAIDPCQHDDNARLTAENTAPLTPEQERIARRELMGPPPKPKTTRLEKFWVVTQPRTLSTLIDVVFETTAARLLVQGRGGLDPDDVVATYLDGDEAREHGLRLLAMRDRTLDAKREGR